MVEVKILAVTKRDNRNHVITFDSHLKTALFFSDDFLFLISPAFQDLNEDGGVPQANSVSIADGPRVSYLKTKAKQRSSTDRCPFRHGKRKRNFLH